MTSYGLMYSGGVDSILCLKKIVDKGIIPILFHMYTYKLNTTHERMIRRNARRLSPKSPYYVIRPYTVGYNAELKAKFPYYAVNLDGKGKVFFTPLRYVDKLVLGYFCKPTRGKRSEGHVGCHQQSFKKYIDEHNLKCFVLPLMNYNEKQIDDEFLKLPLEIQKDTVSSTRFYKFAGVTIGKPKVVTRLGDYR